MAKKKKRAFALFIKKGLHLLFNPHGDFDALPNRSPITNVCTFAIDGHVGMSTSPSPFGKSLDSCFPGTIRTFLPKGDFPAAVFRPNSEFRGFPFQGSLNKHTLAECDSTPIRILNATNETNELVVIASIEFEMSGPLCNLKAKYTVKWTAHVGIFIEIVDEVIQIEICGCGSVDRRHKRLLSTQTITSLIEVTQHGTLTMKRRSRSTSTRFPMLKERFFPASATTKTILCISACGKKVTKTP